MFNTAKKNKACRLCDSENLRKAFDLGASPPGNDLYLSKHETKKKDYPLITLLCMDCGHLQLSHKVDAKELFQKQYTYVSGTSFIFREYLKNYADETCKEFKNKDNFSVLDIGSNDGTALGYFKDNGCSVLGIDPACEVVNLAIKNGINTIPNFFNNKNAQLIKKEYGSFDLITSHNTFAHVDDLRETFLSVKELLHSDSIFIFEVGYRLDVIKNFWFDTIYHEHIDYHAIYPLKKLLSGIGIKIFRVVRGSQQGGSIRLYCCLTTSKRKEEVMVDQLINREKVEKLFNLKTYTNYYNHLKKIKLDLKEIISCYKNENKSIVGFGVPTKATTLMTFFDLNENDIDYFVDENSLKQNKFTPVGKIPILGAQNILNDYPDLIIIFAWNFADSIISKYEGLKENNVKFLIPLPFPRIVN